jgi:hypothetical protein
MGRDMNVEPNVLILDPVLGTGGLIDLAGRLRAAVEVAEAGDVHGTMPCVLCAAVTARLQRDPRVWDWVISVRDGAGVAAQMVSRGQARFAVLMDPVSGIPDLPGVSDAMMMDSHAVVPTQADLDRMLAIASQVTNTYVPDSYFELLAEGLFGGDPGRSRWQALYTEAVRSRLPMDPVLERSPEWWADEWVEIWRKYPDAVRPWFTRRRHHRMASALSSATGIPITVQPWDELAWLTDPSVVADALNQEFEGPNLITAKATRLQ